ncbi:MAG: GMC family oxidoreductase [Chitinophagaceae bacterium]|jgi:choline dehydrogenase-like flavoprotein|nr:GMC family oxidoreductase [Chitinophagaceae bacterium]
MPDSLDIQNKPEEITSFDAIVVGSGISGGWAAKELCEKGLKTLVLERGRNVEHIKDYPTANTPIWDFDLRGAVSKKVRDENPYISQAAGYDATTAHFFVKDADHPYIQEKPFEWVRGYQVGGKSLIWGRACARWSDMDFTAPHRYGYGIEWPIGYKDVAPWYSHVEKFIGVCGSNENIDTMPAGEYMPPFELNCVEQHLKDVLKTKFNRYYESGRWTQVTQPQEIQKEQNRQCLSRNLCMRGCPYGGYFSSNSSTLPWAQKTGNLTIRPFSVVHSVIYDEASGKASGVKVIDAKTKKEIIYRAKIIFLNASALNTNLILLNSTSKRFPNGLGNDNGVLGKYICFHNYRAAVGGEFDGFEDKYYEVSKPAECIIPNFRNVYQKDTDFVGGYVIFSGGYREKLSDKNIPSAVGAMFKEAISKPGKWGAYMYMQGETIPKETNHVRLSKDKKDEWGIPLLIMSVDYDENDDKMVKDFLEQGTAMLEAAGAKNIVTRSNRQPPGLDIHEMGGARMGKDPATSLLNEWNQLHLCKNVFVTDGACMASTGNQSPSILYMTLTARAVDYAVEQLKKGTL